MGFLSSSKNILGPSLVWVAGIATVTLGLDNASATSAPFFSAGTRLFADHDQAYYRLPSMLVTSQGTVLAAGQKRWGNLNDFAPSGLVLRRSLDGGRTFQPEQTLFEAEGECTFNGNLVQDRRTGAIFACFIVFPATEGGAWFTKTWIPRGGGFSYVKSTDDGKTWSAPIDVMPLPNAEGWHGGGALNNNHGVQLQHGSHAGRLVIAARVFKPGVLEVRGKGGLIYSDDHGATWRVGAVVLAGAGMINGELTIGEAPDGDVYVNSRNDSGFGPKGTHPANVPVIPAGIVAHRRIYSRSRDGGESYYAEGCHEELYDGGCNAGQAWVPRDDGRGGVMLLTAPAVRQRSHLTGYISRNGGRSWEVAGLISEKSGGYSDDAATSDGTILTLYENARGDTGPRGLFLARYNLAGLAATRH